MVEVEFKFVKSGQRFYFQNSWWSRRSDFYTDDGSLANAESDSGMITYVGPSETVAIEGE